MVDPHAAVLDFLEADSTFAAASSGGIYAGRDVPPSGYTPDDGACTVFKVRGGRPDYDDALLLHSVQFKCYGSSEAAAMTCYRALYDALHNGHDDTILHAESEVLGHPLEEPETQWRYVLSYFKIMVRQS